MKRTIYVILILLANFTLSLSGQESGNSSLKVMLNTERSVYYEGEQINLTLSFKNNSTSEIKITQPLVSRIPTNMNIHVKNKQGEKVEMNSLVQDLHGARLPEYEFVKKEVKPGETWSVQVPISVYYDLTSKTKNAEETYKVKINTNGNTASCQFTVAPILNKSLITTKEIQYSSQEWRLPDSLTVKLLWITADANKKTSKNKKWILAYYEDNPWTGGWKRLSSKGKEKIVSPKIAEGVRVWEHKKERPKYSINHHFRRIPFEEKNKEHTEQLRKRIPNRPRGERATIPTQETRGAYVCRYVAISWLEDKRAVKLFVQGRYIGSMRMAKRGYNNMQVYGLRPWRYETLVGPKTISKNDTYQEIDEVKVKNGLIKMNIKNQNGLNTELIIDEEGKNAGDD